MSARISVVIPSYNHGRFLHQTINSVLEQEQVDLELVIIDDGSSDDSWDIIQHYAKIDPRVRALKQENQGAHAAINRGLNLASGEFLCILNSDDRYVAGRLKQLMQLAEANKLDFIATGLRLIDSEGHAITDDPWLQEYQRMEQRAAQDGLWAALLERNVTVSTSNFFIRRRLYEQLGPIRPLRYNMDWDYVLRAYLVNPAAFVWRYDLILWEYRLHGKNTILGGLPTSAIEANHLLLRSIQQAHGVPNAALAGLRRHYKLIRQHQVAQVAAERDTVWEQQLHQAHAGWQRSQSAFENMERAFENMKAAYQNVSTAHQSVSAAYEQTHAELMRAQRDLHWMRFSPLFWLLKLWRRRQQRRTAANPTPTAIVATQAEPNALPQDPSQLRVAAHLHVYYIDLFDELLDAAATLPPQSEVFITTPHDPDLLLPQAQKKLGHIARVEVLQVPNQGKDIGPFIAVLRHFNLASYDLILKIHSKRSQNAASYLAVIRRLFGQDIVDGDDWRRKLIHPIAGSKATTAKVLEQFTADPKIGMIGAQQFLCTAPDANTKAYAELCARLQIETQPLFFGGTMFWIRGSVLQRFIDANFNLDDFDPAEQKAVENTLEHQLERVFGALVRSYGLTVAGR